MTDVWDYEGEYKTADGVAIEARYQHETDLFVLSRVERPEDLRAVAGPEFINVVADGTITPMGAGDNE